METTIVTYSALAALVTLTGLLIRVLIKSDDRWERILDAQAQSIEDCERERDTYRRLYHQCVEEVNP